jgi:hypothetical protein
MTADGWTVEVIVLDGRQWYEVKYNGRFAGGGPCKRHRLVATVEEVPASSAKRSHDCTSYHT